MNFRVIEYKIINGVTESCNIIEVFCVNGSKETSINIRKQSFEFFLLSNNKLSWIINKIEKDIFRVEEVEGTMSYEEYWQDDITALCDLKDYINSMILNRYIFNKLRQIQ